MLLHIGQTEAAEKAHNAFLKTLEDGINTYDIFQEGISKEKVGTQEFAKAVIDRLGSRPDKLQPVYYSSSTSRKIVQKAHNYVQPVQKKERVGLDVLIDYPKADPTALGAILEKCNGDDLNL